MIAQMVIDTVEFLAVLKRLKPKRTSKATLAEEVYIAFFNGEAIFCVRGIQTKCLVENANWSGYISTNSGALLSFLKAPPSGQTVKLSVQNNQFQIENLKMPCKTMRSPEWITAMSFEAHLHDDSGSSAIAVPHYCPKCGKKRGEFFHQVLNHQLSLGDEPPSKYPTSRRCGACKYEWLELADV